MSALPSMSGRALIAAGGTGGHVYPALAVAGLLTEQGWSVDWVGTERGIEQRLVPVAGLPLHHLSVSGLRGKNWLARAQGALRLIAALWQSLSLMWRVKPDVVLGMGGYAAGPAGLAAWLTRRPLVIHEQNSVAGTTNRWLAPLARRVLCGLPGGFAAGRKAEVVGNPVRQTLTPVDRGELASVDRCQRLANWIPHHFCLAACGKSARQSTQHPSRQRRQPAIGCTGHRILFVYHQWASR